LYAVRSEPDGQCHRNLTVGIVCDVTSFLAYYDASAAGLMAADAQLTFGGPAADGAMQFLYALVQHCINGTNAITGATGCGRVDYFNGHFKGAQSTELCVAVASFLAAVLTDIYRYVASVLVKKY
jgi:hypothetical protein